MVAADLQRELIDVITDVLSDIVTVKANGDTAVGFTGYPQFLPKLVNDDDTEDVYFPYFLVRISNGEVDENDGWPLWRVSVTVLLGIHDDRTENQGHYSILTAITRITSHFDSTAVLGEARHISYRCDSSKTAWALQDEDTYPYYFGAVSLQFWLPMMGRKELDNGWEESQL